MKKKIIILPVLIASCFAGLPTGSLAQTWDGGAGTNAWDNPVNWFGNALPATDGTAAIILNTTEFSPTNQNLANPLNLFSLNYSGTATTFNINAGNPITVGAGGVSNANDTSFRVSVLLSASATQSWTPGSGANIQALSGVSVAAGQTVTLVNNTGTVDYTFNGTGGSGTGTVQLGSNAQMLVSNLAAFGSASLAAQTGGSGGTVMGIGAGSGTLTNSIAIGTRTVSGDSFQIRASGAAVNLSTYTLSGAISGDLAVVAPNLGNSRGLMLDGNGINNAKVDIILSGNNSGLTGSGGALNEILVANSAAVIAANANALGNQSSNTPSITLGNNDGGTTAFSAALLSSAAVTFNNRISIDDKTTGVMTVGGIQTSGTATFTGNIAVARLVGLTTPLADTQLNLFQAVGGQSTFSGIISNSPALAPDNRALAVTKDNLSNTTVGAANRTNGGVVELTGANTYTGGTTISVGTLLVNNTTGSGTGTGSVSIAAGAVLGGNGTIAGTTTISGSLRPGNSIGTLTVNNSVTWNGGDAWVFELGTAASSLALANSGGSTEDLLNIVGGSFLKGSGSTWAFDFASTGGAGWYQIVNWSGTTTFAETDFSPINVANGFTASFVIDAATSALYVNVVPEPGVLAFLGVALVALHARRRVKTGAWPRR